MTFLFKKQKEIRLFCFSNKDFIISSQKRLKSYSILVKTKNIIGGTVHHSVGDSKQKACRPPVRKDVE